MDYKGLFLAMGDVETVLVFSALIHAAAFKYIFFRRVSLDAFFVVVRSGPFLSPLGSFLLASGFWLFPFCFFGYIMRGSFGLFTCVFIAPGLFCCMGKCMGMHRGCIVLDRVYRNTRGLDHSVNE